MGEVPDAGERGQRDDDGHRRPLEGSHRPGQGTRVRRGALQNGWHAARRGGSVARQHAVDEAVLDRLIRLEEAVALHVGMHFLDRLAGEAA